MSRPARSGAARAPHGPPDVVVVGGGPAGSTTAGLLALRGWRVLLLDRARFPRPKPCGECLNPGALEALGRLGLLDAVLALDPAPLAGWRIRASGRDVEGRFAAPLHGLGVPRSDLDAVLLECARSRGVEVREGARVTGVMAAPSRGGPVRVLWRSGGRSDESLETRAVVGADGLRSVVSRSLGLVARPPKLRKVSLTCRLAWSGPPLSGGILDVEDGITLGLAPVRRSGRLWNATVTAGSNRWGGAMARDPAGFVRAVLDDRMGRDSGRRVVGGPWASGPFDWPVRRAWAPGVALVGDAAGYFDPFTGQGIHQALRSAELAAGAVDATLRASGTDWVALRAYGQALRAELRGTRWLQRLLEAVMARPRLRGSVLDALSGGGALDELVRVTGDAAPVSALLRPRWWRAVLRGAARAGEAHADGR